MSGQCLLDTNVVIAILNDNAPVREKLKAAVDTGEVLLSSIVLYELWFGVSKGVLKRSNEERLRAFMAGPLTFVAFDDDDAKAAGELRATLETNGKPIGPYDVLIAGQALRLGATLVTANVKEFSRIDGLIWQDWIER